MKLTGLSEHETVPDAFVASADDVELLDVDPAVLRRRIGEGAVFAHGEGRLALAGYFSGENLVALRLLALGWLEGRNLVDVSARAPAQTAGTRSQPNRVVAALTGEPEGEHVIRRAAQLAAASAAELVGVHVRSPTARPGGAPSWLERQQRLLLALGGRYVEVGGGDVATAVLDFVRSEHAHRWSWAPLADRDARSWHGWVVDLAIRSAGAIEVHVIPARRPAKPPNWLLSEPLRRHAGWACRFAAESRRGCSRFSLRC